MLNILFRSNVLAIALAIALIVFSTLGSVQAQTPSTSAEYYYSKTPQETSWGFKSPGLVYFHQQ